LLLRLAKPTIHDMFERRQRERTTLGNYALGRSVVESLAWAASSNLDNPGLRAELRRRNPELNLTHYQIAVQAIADLTDDNGYIAIGEAPFGKMESLIDSGQAVCFRKYPTLDPL